MREYWTKHRNAAKRAVVVGALCSFGLPVLSLVIGVLTPADRSSAVVSSSSSSVSTSDWISLVAILVFGITQYSVGRSLLRISGPESSGSFTARFGDPGAGGSFDHIDHELRGPVGFIGTAAGCFTGRVFVTRSWIVAVRGLRSDAMPWTDVASVARRVDPGAAAPSFGSTDPAWITVNGASGHSLTFAVAGEAIAGSTVGALRTMASGGAWTGDVVQLGDRLTASAGPAKRELGSLDQLDATSAWMLTIGTAAITVGSFGVVGRTRVLTAIGIAAGSVFAIWTLMYLFRAVRHPKPPAGVALGQSVGSTPSPVLIMRSDPVPPMTHQPAPSGPPPGWYADPGGAPRQRWWDGVGWTEHTSA